MKPIEEVNLNMVDSFDDVQKFFNWLGERRNFLAWDSETSGLNPFAKDAQLRLIQFGDVDTGWVFRADRWGLGVAEEVFRKYEGRFAGQNVPFDIRWLEAHSDGIQVPWGNQFDTKVMGHILDPTKSTSLKAMSSRFLSPTAKALQGALSSAMKKQGWGWGEIPYNFEIYWAYAAMDTILTARIAEDFWPKIESEFLACFDLESQVQKICSAMETRGISLDINYCNEKYNEILDFTAETDKWCMANYNIHPGQNQEVALILVREGVDLSKTTATGDFTMDKDVLEGIQHPLAQAVLKHRQATKIGSTYFRNYLEGHTNGVLHPSINTLGARTGRMTIQNPAAQTLPRGRVVRDAFIPRPGNLWLCVDFSNIEMKLLAHFSYLSDPGAGTALLDAARASDMHLEMAKLIYHDESIMKSDPRRQVTKNSNFAKAFCAGVEKFAWTSGIELSDAAAFLDLYDSMFPSVNKFQQAVISTVKQRAAAEGRGYARSPLGRKHYADKGKEYAVVNYEIQGTAAEAFKQALVDLDNAGYGQYMLLPVHDEQNFEVPIEHADDLKHDIEEIMVRTNYSLPLTVEGSLGSCWGEAK